ncbi:hypothetical protein SNEBB_002256 [Seison nebaliae]|nr:hypothetical protein SNEBB_002256 [Seison nebaliae]
MPQWKPQCLRPGVETTPITVSELQGCATFHLNISAEDGIGINIDQMTKQITQINEQHIIFRKDYFEIGDSLVLIDRNETNLFSPEQLSLMFQGIGHHGEKMGNNSSAYLEEEHDSKRENRSTKSVSLTIVYNLPPWPIPHMQMTSFTKILVVRLKRTDEKENFGFVLRGGHSFRLVDTTKNNFVTKVDEVVMKDRVLRVRDSTSITSCSKGDPTENLKEIDKLTSHRRTGQMNTDENRTDPSNLTRDHMPFIITSIRSDSPADRDATMKIGDRLLRVNNRRITSLTLTGLYDYLNSIKSHEIDFTIEYDVAVIDQIKSSRGPLLIEIEKSSDSPIGLELQLKMVRYTKHSTTGNAAQYQVGLQELPDAYNKTKLRKKDGIWQRCILQVKSVRPGSIADRCGVLHANDQILSINHKPFEQMSLREANQILNESSGEFCYIEIMPLNSMDQRRVDDIMIQQLLQKCQRAAHSSKWHMDEDKTENEKKLGKKNKSNSELNAFQKTLGENNCENNCENKSDNQINNNNHHHHHQKPDRALVHLNELHSDSFSNTHGLRSRNDTPKYQQQTKYSTLTSSLNNQLDCDGHCETVCLILKMRNKHPQSQLITNCLLHSPSLGFSLRIDDYFPNAQKDSNNSTNNYNHNDGNNNGAMYKHFTSSYPKIMAIETDSVIDNCPSIQIGDHLKTVNGYQCRALSYQQLASLLDEALLRNCICIEIGFTVADSISMSEGIFSVRLSKLKKDLGLSFYVAPKPPNSNNVNNGDNMHLNNDIYPLICDIEKGSVAYRCGMLEIGDKLLALNGKCVRSYRVEDINKLFQTNADHVQLKIQKDKNIDDVDDEKNIVYTVELQRNEKPLGLTISGTEEPFQPIYVSNVCSGGMAEKTQAIHVGDRIVAINGMLLKGKGLSDAISMLKSSRNSVMLKISRPVQRLSGTYENFNGYSSSGEVSNRRNIKLKKLCSPSHLTEVYGRNSQKNYVNSIQVHHLPKKRCGAMRSFSQREPQNGRYFNSEIKMNDNHIEKKCRAYSIEKSACKSSNNSENKLNQQITLCPSDIFTIDSLNDKNHLYSNTINDKSSNFHLFPSVDQTSSMGVVSTTNIVQSTTTNATNGTCRITEIPINTPNKILSTLTTLETSNIVPIQSNLIKKDQLNVHERYYSGTYSQSLLDNIRRSNKEISDDYRSNNHPQTKWNYSVLTDCTPTMANFLNNIEKTKERQDLSSHDAKHSVSCEKLRDDIRQKHVSYPSRMKDNSLPSTKFAEFRQQDKSKLTDRSFIQKQKRTSSFIEDVQKNPYFRIIPVENNFDEQTFSGQGTPFSFNGEFNETTSSLNRSTNQLPLRSCLKKNEPSTLLKRSSDNQFKPIVEIDSSTTSTSPTNGGLCSVIIHSTEDTANQDIGLVIYNGEGNEVLIDSILPNSRAAEIPSFTKYSRILEINEINTKNMRCSDVLSLLRSSTSQKGDKQLSFILGEEKTSPQLTSEREKIDETNNENNENITRNEENGEAISNHKNIEKITRLTYTI